MATERLPEIVALEELTADLDRRVKFLEQRVQLLENRLRRMLLEQAVRNLRPIVRQHVQDALASRIKGAGDGP